MLDSTAVTFFNELNPVASVFASLVVVGGFVFALYRWGLGLLRKAFLFLTRYQPTVPRETIRVQPVLEGCYWTPANEDGNSVGFFVAKLFVTNIIDRDVHLLSAIFEPGRIKTGITLIRTPNNVWCETVPTGRTVEMISQFRRTGKKLLKPKNIVHSLHLVDQFNNIHSVGRIVFKLNLPRRRTKLPKQKSEENLFDLSNKIEKEVATVLKSELISYAKNGRGIGGLGTVHTGEQKKHDHLIQQHSGEISRKPRTRVVSSRNINTLLSLYGNCESDGEKATFRNVLASRISRDIEYCRIAYFICLALHRMGELERALNIAETHLKGDDEHGFSNMLFLVNLLLRYEHCDFTNDRLDWLERYSLLHDPDGHHSLQKKITEIRAYNVEDCKNRQIPGADSGS